MSRPQKQCIFCSNPANSKEHFWSEWMHDLLPKLPNPRHGRRVVLEHPTEGTRESVKDGRPGGVETIKLRVVCKQCNNTWMNRLEGQARPFLTPLIQGMPIVLDFEQMAVIARWVALKCIVVEHGDRDNAVTQENDRFAFREHGKIPDYFRIYIANHNMDHGVGFTRHSSCISLSDDAPDPVPVGAFKNVQTISFILGRIFIHLNASRVENFAIEDRYQTFPINVWDNCRIWPFQHHEMVWPRRPLLDRDGVDRVAFAFEAIRKLTMRPRGSTSNPGG